MSIPISLEGVQKTYPAYGAGGVTHAVDSVSLEIRAGELFFLLGPSGCGKTTLLRMIAGFIPPTTGTIRFGTQDVTQVPPNQRNTGMVFQSYALWPHMTVGANVAFGLNVRKVPAQETAERVRAALAAVRLEEYAARKPNQLSGGQQQRVALARALVIRPDVLLLDEPLSNLDAKLRVELRAEIRRICKSSGITTVYVTHDQKEALSMADRIAIMNRGRVVQVGTSESLYSQPRDRFVAEFLGDTNILDGVVINQAGDAVEIDCAGTRLQAHANGFTWHTQNRVWVSIRPERLQLLPPAERHLCGTVTDRTYLGEAIQYDVAVAGAPPIRVLTIEKLSTAVGETVAVKANPEDIVLLHPVDSASR